MSAADEARTVHVSGLSEKTSEAELRKFFSFCGALDDVKLEAGKATLTFNRASAAKTASFLSGGTLDGSTITVTSSGAATPNEEHASAAHVDGEADQASKPRAAVAAEYLAAGYALSDQVISRAIELDSKHGVSKRFSDFFNPLVQSATAKAKELDAQKGISQRATSAAQETDAKYGVSAKSQQAVHVGRTYYEKALSSSFGARLQSFYLQGAKQVTDVHEEARRIADSRKPQTAATGAASTESGPSTVAPVTTQGSTISATPQVPLPSATITEPKA